MRNFERDVQDIVLACLAGETVTYIAPHHAYAQEVYVEAQRRLARLRPDARTDGSERPIKLLDTPLDDIYDPELNDGADNA